MLIAAVIPVKNIKISSEFYINELSLNEDFTNGGSLFYKASNQRPGMLSHMGLLIALTLGEGCAETTILTGRCSNSGEAFSALRPTNTTVERLGKRVKR